MDDKDLSDLRELMFERMIYYSRRALEKNWESGGWLTIRIEDLIFLAEDIMDDMKSKYGVDRV